MIEPRWIMLGLLLPAAMAAAVLLAVALPRRRSLGPRRAAAAWALAVAAGWTAAYLATGGVPGEPWNTGENWLLPLGLAAALLAAAPGSLALQATLRLALMLGIAYAMMQPAILWVWAWWQTLLWVIAVGCTTWLCTTATEALGRGRAGHELPIALTITAASAGAITAMTDSMLIGQFGGALAAVMAGGAVAATLLPGRIAAHGVAAVAMPLIATVLLFGTHSSDLPMRYALLVIASPTLMWIGELPWLRRRLDALPARGRPWTAGAIRLAATAAPLAAALAIITPRFLDELNSVYPYR
jgi:hypothetical protein